MLLAMTILLVSGAYFFLGSASIARNAIERDRITARALAQAKDALIGYAVTYAASHAGMVNGYLPCPDLSGTAVGGEGGAEGNCGARNVSAIGKLPWKTLDLPPLKDGSGECLWYAVSGTYKNSPDSYFMDWDSDGLFQVMASDGVSFLAGSTPGNRAVAVVFAPGIAKGAQRRIAASATPSCGGNYMPANYLDNDTVHGIDNAAVSAIANAVARFILGPVRDAFGNTIVNDRLITVTREDIFNALKKRSDFADFVDTSLLNTASSCLSGTLPAPITINFDTMSETAGSSVGDLVTGRIPFLACTDNAVRKWRDNLLYATCAPGTQCLKVNGSDCSGIVIFAGERNASQNRDTNAQKNDWSNYLEGDVYTAFTAGSAAFSGNSAYSAISPASDVLACLP